MLHSLLIISHQFSKYFISSILLCHKRIRLNIIKVNFSILIFLINQNWELNIHIRCNRIMVHNPQNGIAIRSNLFPIQHIIISKLAFLNYLRHRTSNRTIKLIFLPIKTVTSNRTSPKFAFHILHFKLRIPIQRHRLLITSSLMLLNIFIHLILQFLIITLCYPLKLSWPNSFFEKPFYRKYYANLSLKRLSFNRQSNSRFQSLKQVVKAQKQMNIRFNKLHMSYTGNLYNSRQSRRWHFYRRLKISSNSDWNVLIRIKSRNDILMALPSDFVNQSIHFNIEPNLQI